MRLFSLVLLLISLPTFASDPYHDSDTAESSRPAERTRPGYLACDLEKAPESGLTAPLYAEPVKFYQRQVKGLYLSTRPYQYGGAPVLDKIIIVYDERKPDSVISKRKSETITVNQRLDKKVDVPFFSDYYGSREVKLSFNPEARIDWNDNGTYRASVPGWQLSVEASDPYHQEGYEASLDCKPKK